MRIIQHTRRCGRCDSATGAGRCTWCGDDPDNRRQPTTAEIVSTRDMPPMHFKDGKRIT